MAESFAYNACEYFDFNRQQDNLQTDSFFEKGESEAFNSCIEGSKENNGNTMFFSPFDDTDDEVLLAAKPKRSLSTPNVLEGLENELQSQHVTDKVEVRGPQKQRPGVPPSLPNKALLPKKFASIEDLSTVKPSGTSPPLRVSRVPSKEHINKLAQPKKSASNGNIPKSLAEAVKKFQMGTPERFRSRPVPKIKEAIAPARGQGSNLQAERRVRSVTVKSTTERTKPLNRKAPVAPLKAGKSPTVPETSDANNANNVEARCTKTPPFKAHSLPKTLHRTSDLNKPLANSQKVDGEQKTNGPSQGTRPGITKVQPFTFDERDKARAKRKEEMFIKVQEEERKAREFHARPIPKKVLKSRTNSIDGHSEASSYRGFKKSTEEMDLPVFKARPATVLHTKPFVPQKKPHELQIETFFFSTEERAVERQNFEEQLKTKEEQIKTVKMEAEARHKAVEDEQIKQFRKQAEHKAQPIRKYKEVTIQKGTKVTIPVSPNFHTDKLRNKENVPH